MKLLVDIGNTRLKWALATGTTLTLEEPLPHQSANLKSTLLKQWWLLPQAPTQLAISCVGCTHALQQVITCAQELWPKILIEIPQAQASLLGVRNAYAQPEKLGVDRWLAMLAVRQITQQPVCVIDCGTAITVDFINAQGQHLGGVISPGLTLMKQSLVSGTEQLPYTDRRFVVGLANHTTAAIYSGTLLATVGLVERIVNAQAGHFRLFLTGGDAAVVAAELRLGSEVFDDLVLQGLLAVVTAKG